MPTTVETLTLIWRRVLQRSPISPEDSFFDIGGTDALADLLCSEIGQRGLGCHFGEAHSSQAFAFCPSQGWQ